MYVSKTETTDDAEAMSKRRGSSSTKSVTMPDTIAKRLTHPALCDDLALLDDGIRQAWWLGPPELDEENDLRTGCMIF
jgi:hypothetical protein